MAVLQHWLINIIKTEVLENEKKTGKRFSLSNAHAVFFKFHFHIEVTLRISRRIDRISAAQSSSLLSYFHGLNQMVLHSLLSSRLQSRRIRLVFPVPHSPKIPTVTGRYLVSRIAFPKMSTKKPKPNVSSLSLVMGLFVI